MRELLSHFLGKFFAGPDCGDRPLETTVENLSDEDQVRAEQDAQVIWQYYRAAKEDPAYVPELLFNQLPGLSADVKRAVEHHYRALEENRTARLLGRCIGGYRILYRIGVGGMGEVYAVQQERKVLRELRALKTINLDHSQTQYYEELRSRLKEEARLMEQLLAVQDEQGVRLDEYVVRLFDADEDPETGLIFIVTELIDGRSLWDLVAHEVHGGPLPSEEALCLVTRACRGLKAFHAAGSGLVHRDVTPRNLMLTRGEKIKIIDLGLTRPVLDDSRLIRTGPGYHTWRSGWFASPEQHRGQAVDHRTDIYSLGKTLYFLVKFRREWLDEAPNYELRLEDDETWRDIPPELAAVIRQATNPDPAQRYASAALMLEHLVRLGGNRFRPDQCLDRLHRLLEEDDPMVNIRVGADLGTSVPPLRESSSPHEKPTEPGPRGRVGEFPAGHAEEVSPPGKQPAGLDRPTAVSSTPRSRRTILLAAAAVILLVPVGGWLLTQTPAHHGRSPEPSVNGNSPPDTRDSSPPSVRYHGRIDVLIERKDDVGAIQLLRLNQAGALPLRKTDKFRIEGQVDPPAYLYVVWVDPGHDITPVYPWDAKVGWGSRPPKETPTGRVSLPPNVGNRYTAPDAKAGVATMVLFARPTPLDVPDELLRKWFAELPDLPLPAGGEQAAVWFDDYVEARDPDRPRTFAEVGADDPFARWQGQLQTLLGGQAAFQTAVSFARTGGK